MLEKTDQLYQNLDDRTVAFRECDRICWAKYI